jgi:hypothetical protein
VLPDSAVVSSLHKRGFEGGSNVGVVPDRHSLNKLKLVISDTGPSFGEKVPDRSGTREGGAPGGMRAASAVYIGSRASKFGPLIAASHCELSFVISSVRESAHAGAIMTNISISANDKVFLTGLALHDHPISIVQFAPIHSGGLYRMLIGHDVRSSMWKVEEVDRAS